MASPKESKARALEELRSNENECRRCVRNRGVRSYVFGAGDPGAAVMFIGEAPGYEEDRRGEPFVGRAGKLLDSLLASIGLRRKDVYITNVVKCRPMRDPSRPGKPGNDRPPSRKEVASCLPVLEQQIAIIRPRLICTLGNTPLKALLAVTTGITALHGRLTSYRGIALLPAYHPAAALRNPALRETMRDDMEIIKRLLAKGPREPGTKE